MADEFTSADALRLYLSGAGADGGAQADPDLALGNFRSSSELIFLGIVETDPIANLSVDYASGANGVGVGVVQVVSPDQVRYTAPGSAVVGDAVTILNGQTKVLLDGEDASKYVRVSRSTADDLAGTVSITLTNQFNNLFGFDNVDSDEALAGDDEYRAFFVKNVSASDIDAIKLALQVLGPVRVSDDNFLPAGGAGTIKLTAGGFQLWPERGFCRIETSGGALKEIVYYESRNAGELTVPATGRGLLGTAASLGAVDDNIYPVPGVRIGIEAPSAQPAGFIQTIANEDTAPAAIAWFPDILTAAGPSIGTLAAGEIYGIWIHRQVPAAMVAEALRTIALQWDYEA